MTSAEIEVRRYAAHFGPIRITSRAHLLPGHLVSALITAVVPSGLNVKVCGFFDGTIDLAHLALGEEDIEDKYKLGKKVGTAPSALLTRADLELPSGSRILIARVDVLLCTATNCLRVRCVGDMPTVYHDSL